MFLQYITRGGKICCKQIQTTHKVGHTVHHGLHQVIKQSGNIKKTKNILEFWYLVIRQTGNSYCKIF